MVGVVTSVPPVNSPPETATANEGEGNRVGRLVVEPEDKAKFVFAPVCVAVSVITDPATVADTGEDDEPLKTAAMEPANAAPVLPCW